MKTLQDLFQRYRRPGDFFIAALAFLFALFLLFNLPTQAPWLPRVKTFAQPAFWPGVAVIAMVVFSLLHLIGAMVSERIPGRMAEVLEWIKAVEYAIWFMAYVWLVPIIGYLPATLAFTILLTLRLGYRGWRWILAAAVFGTLVVVIFKGFLGVRIPAGEVYQSLPSGPFRTFVMTYL
ncbi:tripartite tricarboxylate transporter TctB family protein [Chachezhania antarctica]|uniref:tripartite tricarboxylate transporter TctB family protein n=1 Tax=Chachezhania antarctica TaxID=2340860 RepID=UPI000EAEFE2E|nr:tripartite tricarboxylate transporter TctB family protein [Chachezhania antarctica]|tara:strand:- start:4854 stop:5387 length:534 start_codon:yes stop_codon:yes gene_type:complete